MFEAIGVSERTRKPWTVVVSFIGQLAMIGVAILVPLVGTDALPHRPSWISLPEPPPAMHHHAAQAQAQAKPANVVPPQFTAKGLVLPTKIPDKAVILQDSEPVLSADNGVGLPGGIGFSNGSGNGVIDSLVGSTMATPPPPQPVVKKQPSPPATPPRIKVGGSVQQGKLLSGPRPVYPQLARAARIEGTVRLEAVISREGAILNLRAVSGHPLLIPAALAAVEQWTFRPTFLNGDPVEVATTIDVTFTLQK